MNSVAALKSMTTGTKFQVFPAVSISRWVCSYCKFPRISVCPCLQILHTHAGVVCLCMPPLAKCDENLKYKCLSLWCEVMEHAFGDVCSSHASAWKTCTISGTIQALRSARGFVELGGLLDHGGTFYTFFHLFARNCTVIYVHLQALFLW